MQVTIGTRGSLLALWQANWVKSVIEKIQPDCTVSLDIIKTKGDKILDVPLAKVGGKGLFVKEIEEALLAGKVDLAVHSMKDMPAQLPDGLCIGAVPERENHRDVLISKNNIRFADLPKEARIGTSSLRRSSQMKHIRPDIRIVPLRGNLDTRIRKLATENLDAIVLAAAGMKRLGHENAISEYLSTHIMLPAVGQGALCIEIRKDDPVITPIVRKINHEPTRITVLAERSFLHRLEGGCQVPIAALGRLEGDDLSLTGLVADIEGKTMIRETISAHSSLYEAIGIRLAEKLLAMGAESLLEQLKQNEEGHHEG
ncbi:MAG: hydroxymethylbilane synthase [Desulfobacteraceae bacterium]|nr:MAG: hydroxymethylbilane synthase [Desulfobacteraceae bacterium]